MKQRILTGIIAGIGFFLLLYLGTYWFSALILGVSLIGMFEYVKMNGYKPFSLTTFIGYVGVACFSLPWESLFGLTSLSMAHFIWIFLFILMCLTVLSKNKVTIDHISTVFLGMVYIGIGCYYMIETRMIESGLFWSLLIFICIWSSDSGAYFTGSAFGKHPLWPTISPKKSIEGSIGGVVIAMIIAVCFSLARPDLLSWSHALFLGLTIAIVGQMGDLIQSAYKRIKGIKDTGTILPGHGGVLDRVDSWLIVFPMVHLLSLIPHS